MDQYEYIRTAHRVYEKSIRQIQKETGHSRVTIRKVLQDEFPEYKRRSSQSYPVLEIVEDRHQVRSTIIASQLPIDTWHDVIGDPTFADAICDRVVHNAHKIIPTGESMRKIHSGLT
jgi:DNA replication protein DnaC